MQPNSATYRVLYRLRLFLAVGASLLATFWTRLIVIAIAVGILLYLMYTTVWASFGQDLQLPFGITPTNPALNVSLLNEINTARTERTEEARPDFQKYSKFFMQAPLPR